MTPKPPFRKGPATIVAGIVFVLVVLIRQNAALSAAARTVTTYVLYVTVVLAVVQLVLELMPWFRRQPVAADVVIEVDDVPVRETAAFFWLIGAPVVLLLAGFVVGSGIYIYSYLRDMDGLPPFKALMTALLFSVCLYLVFDVLLTQPLYRGFLWDL